MARKPKLVDIHFEDTTQYQAEKTQPQSNRLKMRIEDLKTFKPLTENQKMFFDSYKAGTPWIILHGVAGTGKTFCALYKSIEEVLNKDNPIEKVIIVRSCVQGREMGHLPGDTNEKMEVYKQPYIQICSTLFGRKDAYQRLQEQDKIDFISTSFIRGITLDNCIIIVDETQNCTLEECHAIATRIGNKSKIIWCGDYKQSDLYKKKNDVSGILPFFEICDKMKDSMKIEFDINDIVRSDIVRQYILAKLEYDA